MDDDYIVIGPAGKTRFVAEEIFGSDGEIIAHRDEDKLLLKKQETPKLRSRDSILSLIEEEPLSTTRNAIISIHHSKTRTERDSRPFDQEKLEKLIADIGDLNSLERNRSLDLLSKAYILKRLFPEQFEWVAEQMIDIFDTIEEVDIGPRRGFSTVSMRGPFDFLVPAFRERGIDGWIYDDKMSSGMRRTLMHLLELHLEPPGSVVLIDEYENGMGVNCLPQITELLLQRAGDLQLIFTSHHPFVIEKISKEWWMVMQRNGHDVTVLKADDIKRLNTASNQDAFIQLVNAPEYLNGVS